ncbi:trypsin-like serine protease [Micromonospora chokoriensis]
MPKGKYRFSVKLTRNGIPTADDGRRNSACSGALVAPDWVVPAGHCFGDLKGIPVEQPVADLTTAAVGRADLTGTSGVMAKVIAVRQSPSNDLSLAQLDTPVLGIRPIRLSTTAPAVCDVVRLTGYGSTASENPLPATRLYTDQFTVHTVANSIVGMTRPAPALDISACPYDSGAPYFRAARSSSHWRARPRLPALRRGDHRSRRHHRTLDQEHHPLTQGTPAVPLVAWRPELEG